MFDSRVCVCVYVYFIPKPNQVLIFLNMTEYRLCFENKPLQSNVDP